MFNIDICIFILNGEQEVVITNKVELKNIYISHHKNKNVNKLIHKEMYNITPLFLTNEKKQIMRTHGYG